MAKKKIVNKRKRNKIVFLIGLIAVTVGILITMTFTVFFPAKYIKASGSIVYTQEELIKASGITKKDNLLLLDKEEILKKTQETLPYIGSLEIKRKLPNTVELIFDDVDTYLYFSKDSSGVQTDINFRILPVGIIIAEHQIGIRCGWQLDSKEQNVVINRKADADFIKKVIELSRKTDLQLDLIDVLDSNKLKLEVEGRFTVDFGSRYNFEGKFSQLVKMVNEIDKGEQGKIDLSGWTKENPNGSYFKTENLTD